MRNNVPIILLFGAGVVVIVIIIVLSIPLFKSQDNIRNLFQGKQLTTNGSSSSLLLIQKIPIPNVQGRIDHMAADITRSQKLLFVAEIENNSLDIIDLNTGKRVHSINNGLLGEPQGVVFIPKNEKIFVSNGQDGSVDIFDAKSLKLEKKIQLPSTDADNMRYDPHNGLVYVGYGQGALGKISLNNESVIGNIKLAGHPESFQIEQSTNKVLVGQNNKIFINIPDSNSIIVVDKRKNILTTWSIPNAQNNFPMALDESHHRLFVGTRDPSKLLVFDTVSGKMASSLDIARDPDDIFYDALNKRVYVSCGEGFINIIQQRDADSYVPIGTIPSAQGARTSLFVPELNRFYLAVPHEGNQASEIRVYKVADLSNNKNVN